MPDIEVETEERLETVTIEFYCSVCGKGICSNYTPSKTRGRGQPYFNADPCNCQTDQIEELEQEVRKLEDKINELEQELENAQRD